MSQGYAPPPHGAPQFQAPGPQGPPPPPALGPPVYPAYGPPGYPASPGPAPTGPASPAPGFPPPTVRAPGPPQRPAVIALGCALAVVGSLQWICALSLLWVTATVGTGAFADVEDTGYVFHILDRISNRMLDGLAVPLYLFPLAALTTGFLVLSRRPWTRVAHTVVGLAALAWAAWWLQDNLLWWFSAAWYIVVACLVLWTPGATEWYRWRDDPARRPLS